MYTHLIQNYVYIVFNYVSIYTHLLVQNFEFSGLMHLDIRVGKRHSDFEPTITR